MAFTGNLFVQGIREELAHYGILNMRILIKLLFVSEPRVYTGCIHVKNMYRSLGSILPATKSDTTVKPGKPRAKKAKKPRAKKRQKNGFPTTNIHFQSDSFKKGMNEYDWSLLRGNGFPEISNRGGNCITQKSKSPEKCQPNLLPYRTGTNAVRK